MALGIESLEHVYVRHRRAFEDAGVAILHDREDARDCVHDVFLALCQRPGVCSMSAQALARYFFACVRNAAVTRLRRQRRFRNVLAKIGARAGDTQSEIPDWIERERVAQAIGALSGGQRAVVVMQYFARMTHGEIAAVLQQPIGTVKHRSFVARRRLQATLSACDAHPSALRQAQGDD
ncbi:MAG TPA: sigma-70 family RNA polymerase sigma factor [Candidatus Baltobacteraceae bacterium]